MKQTFFEKKKIDKKARPCLFLLTESGYGKNILFSPYPTESKLSVTLFSVPPCTHKKLFVSIDRNKQVCYTVSTNRNIGKLKIGEGYDSRY
ncbi:MAG: hypothetical protein IJS09_04255 [Treponema sp.]|nr:hypothetical protein [Treponema sp.]